MPSRTAQINNKRLKMYIYRGDSVWIAVTHLHLLHLSAASPPGSVLFVTLYLLALCLSGGTETLLDADRALEGLNVSAIILLITASHT